MAVIGTPYRLLYWAKNSATGLQGVIARVLKPSGAVTSPIALTEIVGVPGFEGSYIGSFETVEGTDPNGEYVISYQEPDGFRAIGRVTYADQGITDPVGSIDIGINRKNVIEGQVVSKPMIIGLIKTKSDIVGISESKKKISAKFYKDELEYFLDNNQLEGHI